MKKLLALGLLFGLGSAQAATVTWYVHAVFFNAYSGQLGDGTLTGQFDYDSENNQYTNVLLTSTDNVNSQGFLTAEFDFMTGTSSSSARSRTDYASERFDFDRHILNLQFQQNLDQAIGTVSLDPHYSYFNILSCAVGGSEVDDVECFDEDGRHTHFLGSVSTVPVPAAVWLFGSGLGLLGWLRRRQAA